MKWLPVAVGLYIAWDAHRRGILWRGGWVFVLACLAIAVSAFLVGCATAPPVRVATEQVMVP